MFVSEMFLGMNPQFIIQHIQSLLHDFVTFLFRFLPCLTQYGNLAVGPRLHSASARPRVPNK